MDETLPDLPDLPVLPALPALPAVPDSKQHKHARKSAVSVTSVVSGASSVSGNSHQRQQQKQPANAHQHVLLESLGFGPQLSRWSVAEHRFLEVFYGKEFVPTYETIQPQSKVPPRVSFDVASPSRGQLRFHRAESVAAGGRIVRPRTAELTPDLRRRLEGFRELDSIAFVRPVGLGTPVATPVSGVSSLSTTTNSNSIAVPFNASAERHHLAHGRAGSSRISSASSAGGQVRLSRRSASAGASRPVVRPLSREAHSMLVGILGDSLFKQLNLRSTGIPDAADASIAGPGASLGTVVPHSTTIGTAVTAKRTRALTECTPSVQFFSHHYQPHSHSHYQQPTRHPMAYTELGALRVHVRTELRQPHLLADQPAGNGRASRRFVARNILSKYRLPKMSKPRRMTPYPPELPPIPKPVVTPYRRIAVPTKFVVSETLDLPAESGVDAAEQRMERSELSLFLERLEPVDLPRASVARRSVIGIPELPEEEEMAEAEEREEQLRELGKSNAQLDPSTSADAHGEIACDEVDGDDDNDEYQDLDDDADDDYEQDEHTEQPAIASAAEEEARLGGPRSAKRVIFSPDAATEFHQPHRRVGSIFPIDFFIDQTRIDRLVNMLDIALAKPIADSAGVMAAANDLPRGVACRARYWPNPKGTYLETLECLIKSTENPEMWKNCIITSYDSMRNRFLVHWLPGQAYKGTPLNTSDPMASSKLITEILMPAERLAALRLELQSAKLIRDEFERNLALAECVKIIRPAVEPRLPDFPKGLIDGLFVKVKAAFTASSSCRSTPKDANNQLPQMDELFEEEILTSQLLSVYKELRHDFITSELKSLLVENTYFKSFVPPPAEPDSKPAALCAGSADADLPSDVAVCISVGQELSPTVVMIGKHIEPHLNLCTSIAIQGVMSNLRSEVAQLFATAFIDTMRSHVTRVHPSKRRLKVVGSDSESTGDGKTGGQSKLQPGQHHTTPSQPTQDRRARHQRHKMVKNSRLSFRGTIPGSNSLNPNMGLAGSTSSDGGFGAGGTTAGRKGVGSVTGSNMGNSKTPAKPVSQRIFPVVRTTEIHPIIDTDGRVAFVAGDFLDVCEWLQADFDTVVRDQLPLIANNAFRQLLDCFGIHEPDGPAPLHVTLMQRSKLISEAPSTRRQQPSMDSTANGSSPQAGSTPQPPQRFQSSQDLFVRLGRLVTIMTDTFVSPFLSSRILETYKAVEYGRLHISLTLKFHAPTIALKSSTALTGDIAKSTTILNQPNLNMSMSASMNGMTTGAGTKGTMRALLKDATKGTPDSKPHTGVVDLAASDRGANNLIPIIITETAGATADQPADKGKAMIEYDVPLDELLPLLEDRLLGWLHPVPSILPGGVLSSRPVNHNYIEFLYKDLADDSVNACNQHLKVLADRLIPCIERASSIPRLELSIDMYIEANERALEDIQSVRKFAKSCPPSIVRGLFELSTTEMTQQLEKWAQLALAEIAKQINVTISERADAIIARCQVFFQLAPPTTFEETKTATEKFRTMVMTTEWIREQTSWLIRLKAFLEDHGWLQSDADFAKILNVRLTQDRFFAFLKRCEEDIGSANQRLCLSIGNEIGSFLSRWSTIEASAELLFSQPVKLRRFSADAMNFALSTGHMPTDATPSHGRSLHNGSPMYSSATSLAVTEDASATANSTSSADAAAQLPDTTVTITDGGPTVLLEDNELGALSDMGSFVDEDELVDVLSASSSRLPSPSQAAVSRRETPTGTRSSATNMSSGALRVSKPGSPSAHRQHQHQQSSDQTVDQHEVSSSIDLTQSLAPARRKSPNRRHSLVHGSVQGLAPPRSGRADSLSSEDLDASQNVGLRGKSRRSSVSTIGLDSSQADGMLGKSMRGRRVSFGTVPGSTQHLSPVQPHAGQSSTTRISPRRAQGAGAEVIEDPTGSLTSLLAKITQSIELAKAIIAKMECIDNVPQSSEMELVMTQMKARQELVSSMLKLRRRLDYWRSAAIAVLDLDEIAATSHDLMRRIEELATSNSPIAKTTYDDLKMFTEYELPVLCKLKNPIFGADHWEAIRKVLRFHFVADKNSIRDIVDTLGHASLQGISSLIEPIELSANKEHAITNVIKEMGERFNTMPVELEANDRFGLTVVKSLANYISTMESDLLTIGMMVSSKGMDKYVPQLKDLEGKLQAAVGAMREWEQMQPLMINVHGFFESEEVRLQLSVELRRFRVFETGYRVIIVNVQKYSLFSTLIAMHPDLPTSVAEIRHGLRKVIDDVQGWLDNKRLVFPRLFFVSDDELLELVSIAKEPSTVQHQLSRYFYFCELTYTTDVNRDYIVTGIRSAEGETMLFDSYISTRGLGVEQWLAKVEVESQVTLRKILITRMSQLKFEDMHQSWKGIYERMVHDTPTQVTQLAFQILRTAELQACIEDDNAPSISEFVNRSQENIHRFITLIRQGEANAAIINNWKSMIAIELYYRDWGQSLHQKRVHETNSFEWLRGIRYYFSEEDGQLYVRQYFQQTQYGFEYMGASPRISWSSMSEKCYAAIWSAMEVKMGIAGYGPISIGKTEIFKDFARAVGKFAVFFNCSQGVLPHVLTRLMTGMAMTGCYLLMTYLDKLEENSLATVWQAISTLRDLTERKESTSVSYLGRIIKLPPSTNVCFLSTVSAGSLARSDFMGLLRTQLRFVALATPDHVVVARGMLHMAAFNEAQELATKIAQLFTMAGDQLSRQAHYDFNLRTTRTVIRLAEMARNQGRADTEKAAVISAIQAYIRPKLLYDDLPIFSNLLEIVFGVPKSDADDTVPVPPSLSALIDAIRPASLQQLLSKTIGQFQQIVENAQHTLVLGKMSVGKTSLIRSSASLLGAKIHVINPRALPATFLFGFEESTGYQKGVIESIVDLGNKSPTQRHWLVLDGPLEASWADTVSSLLQKEEGGALCLSNGKRVSLHNSMTVVIETDNLDNASAGFIGRFNVVFVRHEWSWRVRLQSWLYDLESRWSFNDPESPSPAATFANMQIQIEGCFSSFMENTLKFVEDCGMKASIPVVFNGTLDILDCLLAEYANAFATRPRSARSFSQAQIADMVEDMFHYAVVWSFGAAIGHEYRAGFHLAFQRMLKVSRSSSRIAAVVADRKNLTVFDLKFDPSSVTWSTLIESSSIDTPLATRVLLQQRDIISLLLRHTKNVLLMGEIGSRKTSVASDIMLELCSHDHQGIIGHASPMLPKSDVSELTNHLQKVLVADDQETGTGHEFYVPVNASSLIIFVDDLHIPSPNPEGSRTVWEFLRFFLDQSSYWCNPQTLRHVRKVAILAVCDLLRNGVVVLPERLMRHFTPVYFNEADVLEDATGQHFSYMLQSSMERFQVANQQSRLYSAINSTLDLLRLLKKQLVLSSHGPFYHYTSHDLEKIFEGFARIRRVFEDRISHSDRNIFDDCLNKISKQYFHLDHAGEDSVIYSDLDSHEVPEAKASDFIFRRLPTREVTDATISDVVQILRMESKDIDMEIDDITLFPDGVAHFARLDRILAQKRNAHAILACRPGMDISMDVVRLVVAARDLPLKELHFREHVNLDHWRLFIRKQVTDAGLNEKRVVICITVLSCCSVPVDIWGDLHAIMDGARSRHLWSPNEYEDLMTKISHQYRTRGDRGGESGSQTPASDLEYSKNGFNGGMFGDANGRQPSHLEVVQYWARRVQANVCILLRVDATDIDTHQQLLRFPRLITRTTIDIYREYSENELFQLATQTFKAMLDDEKTFSEEIEIFSHLVVKMYLSARNAIKDPTRRRNTLTPIDFAHQVRWMSRQLTEQDRALRIQITEYSASLRRIARLKERVIKVVENGKQELADLPEMLSRISNEILGLSIAIQTNQDEVQRLTNIIRDKRETALRLAMEREAAVANAGLTEAKGAFEEAIQNLRGIKKNDLEELKTFVIPPPLLALVADGLCILFDRPGGWGEARKLLSSHTFLQRILQYDFQEISENKLDKLRKIVDLPGFQVDKSSKVGTAVKCLCQWLKAMFRYCREMRSRLMDDADAAKTKAAFTLTAIEDEMPPSEVEQAELEQLKIHCDAMKERKEALQLQKRELSGRLTLIREIFAPDSIFDNAKPDHVTESQWIQQAFHCDEGGVNFTDEDVFKAHAEYEQELRKLDDIKHSMSKDVSDAATSLDDVRAAIESMTLPHLIELMDMKDAGTFTEAAKSTLLQLLKLTAAADADTVYRKLKTTDVLAMANASSGMFKGMSESPLFQRIAFYDSKMVASTAISPFQACRGAFLVRDIVISMHAYYAKKERIGGIIEDSQREVDVKKAKFDKVWSDIYSHLPDYWTFEIVIQKFKEIHDKLRIVNPAEVLFHLDALQKNPLLYGLLDFAARLASWSSVEEMVEQTNIDPAAFGRAITMVKIGDERTQKLIPETPAGLDDIHEHIQTEAERVYVDILPCLPRALSFRILVSLGERRLSELAFVSRRWRDLVRQQQVWKWMSHENGWGVSFNYPKGMDWRDFHHRLHVMRKQRVPEVLEAFDVDIQNLTGLKAYKRMSVFLKKIPEYTKLEKIEQDASRRVADLIQLELTNDVFMAVEDHFTTHLAVLENAAAAAALAAQNPYKNTQKNSSLRFKKAVVTVKTMQGKTFSKKYVHELVVDKAAKLRCLHVNIERVKKHVTRIDTAIIIEVGFPPFPSEGPPSRGPPKIPRGPTPACFGVFSLLANCLKIIYAYHRGVQMGKHIQFQVRFIRALKLLCEKIEGQIAEQRKSQSSLRGDTILVSCAHAFLPPLTSEERLSVKMTWIRAIREHHLMRDPREVFGVFLPKFKTYNTINDAEHVLMNAALLATTESDILIHDSTGLGEQILNEISESLFTLVTVIDARAKNFVALLKTHVLTPGTIIIKNVGIESSIQAEVISFRNARHAAAREKGDLINRRSSKIIICSLFDILNDLEPRLLRMSFSFSKETLQSMLLDILLDVIKPQFHADRNNMRRTYEAQRDDLEKWFKSIIELIRERHTVEEELIHDIIMYQRQNAELENLKVRREEVETPIAPLYASYHRVVGYVMEIWHIMKQLVHIRPAYDLSTDVLLDCFRQSIPESLRNGSTVTELERRDMDMMVDDFTTRVGNRLGRAVGDADRFPLLAVLAVTKMRYYGTITKKDEAVILALAQKRAEITDHAEFIKWLQTKYLPTLDDRPTLVQILDGLITNGRRPSTLWHTSLADVYERRLSPLHRFLVHLVLLPQFVRQGLRDFMQDTSLWTEESRDPRKYYEAAQESSASMILILSVSPPEAYRSLVALSETYEESHLQLSVLNEGDKQGDKWVQKIEFAAENGAWVFIHLDSFWLGHIDKIHQLSKIPSAGFKIWVASLSTSANRIPGWMFRESHIIYDEEDIDPWLIMRKIETFEGVIDDIYRPWLLIVIKFHVSLWVLVRHTEIAFPDFMRWDDTDLRISLRLYVLAARRKLPLETLKHILLTTVYSPESRATQDMDRLVAIWNEAANAYDRVVAVHGTPLEKMTKDGFMNFFAQAKPFMFSVKAMRLHEFGNITDVDRLSLQFCSRMATLLGVGIPPNEGTRTDMQVKQKIGQYLKALPKSINIRLIYENMNAASDSHVKCYLLEEANNYLRLLRRTLEAVMQNTVLQVWVRRSHPTSASLDVWVQDIGRRIKFLDNMPVERVEIVFDQRDLGHIETQTLNDISAKYGMAIVLSGIQADGARMENNHMMALEAGKPDSLPLFLIRPGFTDGANPDDDTLLLPASTHLFVDAEGTSKTMRPRSLKSRGLRVAAVQPQPRQADKDKTDAASINATRPSTMMAMVASTTMPSPPPSRPTGRSSIVSPKHQVVHEYSCAVRVSEEHGAVTELLEDGSRPNQVCRMTVQSTLPPELLLHQGVELLVDTSGRVLPEYLRSSYVDLNYLHSLNSMSDSLDRNVSDASHHFTIYVCSSSDAENERRFLFQHIFPALLKDLAYRHIDLHFVDLKHNRDGELDEEDAYQYLDAACTQIKRSSLFVGIFGSKLGKTLRKRDLPAKVADEHPSLKSLLLERQRSMIEVEIDYALTEDSSRYIHKGQRTSLFYFRDPNFARSVPKSFRSQYEPDDVEEKYHLDQLRQSLSRRFPDRCVTHYPGYFMRVVGREVQMGGLERLGERIRNDLLMGILDIVKQRRRGVAGGSLGTLDVESFAGRESITMPIIQAVAATDATFVHEQLVTLAHTMLVYGPSGMGKTALLSYLCQEFTRRNIVVLNNFVRSWAGSFEVDSMIRRFCVKLCAQLRMQTRRVPTDSAKLKAYFIALLQEVVYYGSKVVIVIDGIDRMVNSQGKHDSLSWLPQPSELGNQLCSNVFWIFSAADDQIMAPLQAKYSETVKMPLDVLSDDDKRKIIADRSKILGLRIDPRSVKYLVSQKASDSPLYLKVVMKEAQQNMANGQFVFTDFHLETTWQVFDQVFQRLEKRHGYETMRLLFSFLSFARNGLREMEVIGLLKLNLIQWNLLFESIEEYIIKTSTGYIIVFHEQFTAAVKKRYLKGYGEAEHFHQVLAEYYLSICNPSSARAWSGSNETRAADITYHQLRAKQPVTEIAGTMCSIGYISAVFMSHLAHELPGYFSEAFFVERYSQNLAVYPKLAYSLALSLPNGFCSYVREEALESFKHYNSEPFLNCLSLAEDQLEMVPLGSHQADIIYCGVMVVGTLGKCCVSVSSDASVLTWNMDTFLFIKTLLFSPIGADAAVQCCFSLNFSELVAFGTRNGHICVYKTDTGMPFVRIENVYAGGMLFFSDDPAGVWQRGPLKTFEWVQFATQLVFQAPANPLDDQREGRSVFSKLPGVSPASSLGADRGTHLLPSTKGGKVGAILARSMDGHKIAFLAIAKRRFVVIMSARTMREICRFAEDSVSESSTGQFSVGKDLIAVILANGDIMVWKIDSHSRVALIRIPTSLVKVSCLNVSIDENMLYFGSVTSVLCVASLRTGQIVKRLAIGEKTVLGQLCIATSKGKERFFLASGPRLSTCDSQSSLRIDGGNSAHGNSSTGHGFDGSSASGSMFHGHGPAIHLRHATPINAVLPFTKKQKQGVEAISVSRDGRLVSWAMSKEFKKLAPVREVFVAEDLTSCRLSQSTGFALVTAGTAAIIWNVNEAQEVLRITHVHALRDAILVKNRVDDSGLTIMEDPGRIDLFLTYDPNPLFSRFVTALPANPHTASKRELLVANDYTVMVLDARTGDELRRFETRGHEMVLDLSWHYTPSGSSHVMYATKTTLFMDGQIWSYGGSLGDTIQIDTCKRDPTGVYVGYSGVETGETFVGKTNLERPNFGIVVVLSTGSSSSSSRRQRVCMLRHDNTRVVQWSFLHDPNYVVTVATDLMVRVWDIRLRLSSGGMDIADGEGGDARGSKQNMLAASHAPFMQQSSLSDSGISKSSALNGPGSASGERQPASSDLSGSLNSASAAAATAAAIHGAQTVQLMGTQIDGVVGHVRAMFPLRSPCTCLSVSADDYVLYTGNEQGDVLQFRLEFGNDK
ncbi:hypothetical protein BC831DRAFT_548196 [Entophlyctis helioformis]|nr:hypothetical protein BC831DRAFT_548196 [Entophlyctis helioformis]